MGRSLDSAQNFQSSGEGQGRWTCAARVVVIALPHLGPACNRRKFPTADRLPQLEPGGQGPCLPAPNCLPGDLNNPSPCSSPELWESWAYSEAAAPGPLPGECIARSAGVRAGVCGAADALAPDPGRGRHIPSDATSGVGPLQADIEFSRSPARPHGSRSSRPGGAVPSRHNHSTLQRGQRWRSTASASLGADSAGAVMPPDALTNISQRERFPVFA